MLVVKIEDKKEKRKTRKTFTGDVSKWPDGVYSNVPLQYPCYYVRNGKAIRISPHSDPEEVTSVLSDYYKVDKLTVTFT